MPVPGQMTFVTNGDDRRGDERLIEVGTFRNVPAFLMDVPETIAQLGYGSHQLFRYYGKFPSVVGREIVKRHGTPGESVLDCYAGSGTTLVEAQMAGLPSFGVDINPLAVLASNVKTSYLDASELREALDRLLKDLGPRDRLPTLLPQAKLDKWFSPETQQELSVLRSALFRHPQGPVRSFLLLAFLGIVRRVSRAYDGEIRPHVNPRKKPRSAVLAFTKKATDMIGAMREVDMLRPPGIPSYSVTGDNCERATYLSLLPQRPGLVVAHPPYLNSFNYVSVFSPEFAWAQGFEEVWGGWDLKAIRAHEHRAWPATNPQVVETYYEDFRRAIDAVVEVALPGATVAVVIGDATIRGRLEQVHERFWSLLSDLGLTPAEIWFRTTHYGTGKYAYSHRADYHGDAEKRDTILFFRTPAD